MNNFYGINIVWGIPEIQPITGYNKQTDTLWFSNKNAAELHRTFFSFGMFYLYKKYVIEIKDNGEWVVGQGLPNPLFSIRRWIDYFKFSSSRKWLRI